MESAETVAHPPGRISDDIVQEHTVPSTSNNGENLNGDLSKTSAVGSDTNGHSFLGFLGNLPPLDTRSGLPPLGRGGLPPLESLSQSGQPTSSDAPPKKEKKEKKKRRGSSSKDRSDTDGRKLRDSDDTRKLSTDSTGNWDTAVTGSGTLEEKDGGHRYVSEGYNTFGDLPIPLDPVDGADALPILSHDNLHGVGATGIVSSLTAEDHAGHPNDHEQEIIPVDPVDSRHLVDVHGDAVRHDNHYDEEQDEIIPVEPPLSPIPIHHDRIVEAHDALSPAPVENVPSILPSPPNHIVPDPIDLQNEVTMSREGPPETEIENVAPGGTCVTAGGDTSNDHLTQGSLSAFPALDNGSHSQLKDSGHAESSPQKQSDPNNDNNNNNDNDNHVFNGVETKAFYEEPVLVQPVARLVEEVKEPEDGLDCRSPQGLQLSLHLGGEQVAELSASVQSMSTLMHHEPPVPNFIEDEVESPHSPPPVLGHSEKPYLPGDMEDPHASCLHLPVQIDEPCPPDEPDPYLPQSPPRLPGQMGEPAPPEEPDPYPPQSPPHIPGQMGDPVDPVGSLPDPPALPDLERAEPLSNIDGVQDETRYKRKIAPGPSSPISLLSADTEPKKSGDTFGSEPKNIGKSRFEGFVDEGSFTISAAKWHYWNSEPVRDNFTESTPIRIFIGNWNLAGKQPPPDVSAWIRTDIYHHIYAIGTCECERSIGASMVFSSKERWESQMAKHLGPNYIMIRSETLGAIHLMIFVDYSIQPNIWKINGTTVPTGTLNMLGNKGATKISFNMGRSKLLFINAHLAAGQKNCLRRTKSFRKILSDKPLDAISIEEYDQIFFFGDLNYRLMLARNDVVKCLANGDVQQLINADQLKLQQLAEKKAENNESTAMGFTRLESSSWKESYESLPGLPKMFRSTKTAPMPPEEVKQEKEDAKIKATKTMMHSESDKTFLDQNPLPSESSGDDADIGNMIPGAIETFEQMTPKMLKQFAPCPPNRVSLSHFYEMDVEFKPTYKYDRGTFNYDSSAKQRCPAYTDRILWKARDGITAHAYGSIPTIRCSDHEAVYAQFECEVNMKKDDATKPEGSKKSIACTIM